MKKLILFLTVMMSFQLAFASVLVVNFPNGNFKVIMDGTVYRPSPNLHFNGINQGRKNITIIRETWDYYGNYSSKTVYDGCINVPRRSRVTANFYRGRMDVQTQPLNQYGNGNYHGNGGFGGNGCAGNNYNNHGGATAIIQLMANESFDSDRVKLGLAYVRGNYATANDIMQMARLFSFDSNRLKFAKQAYAHCVDPQNYYLVTTTFTFSSNKRELLDFIGQGYD